MKRLLLIALLLGLSAGAQATTFTDNFTSYSSSGDLTTLNTNWVNAYNVSTGVWFVGCCAPGNLRELQINISNQHTAVYYATGTNGLTQTSGITLNGKFSATSQGGPAVGIKTFTNGSGQSQLEMYYLLGTDSTLEIHRLELLNQSPFGVISDTSLYSMAYTPGTNDYVQLGQSYSSGAFVFDIRLNSTTFSAVVSDTSSLNGVSSKPGLHWKKGSASAATSWSGAQN